MLCPSRKLITNYINSNFRDFWEHQQWGIQFHLLRNFHGIFFLSEETDFASYKGARCALGTKDLAGRMLVKWPARSAVKMGWCAISWALCCHCFHCWNLQTDDLFPQPLSNSMSLCLALGSSAGWLLCAEEGGVASQQSQLVSAFVLLLSLIPSTNLLPAAILEGTDQLLPSPSVLWASPLPADIGRVMTTLFRCHELLLTASLVLGTGWSWAFYSITTDMWRRIGNFPLSEHIHRGRGTSPLSKHDSEGIRHRKYRNSNYTPV